MTEVRGEGDGSHVGSDGGGGSRVSPSLVSLSTKIMLLVIYLNEFISFLKHTWGVDMTEVRGEGDGGSDGSDGDGGCDGSDGDGGCDGSDGASLTSLE